MDYLELMGVRDLAAASEYGLGVKIAILDSGKPPPLDEGWDIDTPIELYGDVDTFGHSTAIASILFGNIKNTGLCKLATPYYVKVLDSNGLGSVKSVVRGIYKAIRHDVDIINLSLGFARTDECPKALEEACGIAYEAGIPIVCAAGNDGHKVNWPAALDTTICVGSSLGNGLKAPFSCSGEVDFVAPGMNLSVMDIYGSSKVVSGTSFSTALVTGVASLLVRQIKRSNGTCSVAQVKQALRAMAKDVGRIGWDTDTGYGVISGCASDTTVDIKTRHGFFDIIVDGIKTFLGLQ